MKFPLKMPKYVVFWPKCQNILFSFKMAKICKKYFLGKKIFLRALVITILDGRRSFAGTYEYIRHLNCCGQATIR